MLNMFAQQLPEVSYYMYDYARTNPGSFGSKDMICVNGINKQSMVGMPGAPNNFFVNASAPFNLFGLKHGAGVSIYNDVIGFYSDIDVKIGYALRLNLGEGTIGIGVNGGIRQRSIDPQWESNDSGINPSDDEYIPQTQIDANSVGLGVGLFYRTEDIYFGLSVLNAYSTEVDYTEDASGVGGSSAVETFVPHYYVTAGYQFLLTNPSYEISPSVQLYSDGVSVTFDINTIVTYNKKIWGGVSYRAGSAIVGMAGLSILEGLKVGYAYDFQTSSLITESGGSHEFLLNYCFKLGVDKSPEKYKSIRYL